MYRHHNSNLAVAGEPDNVSASYATEMDFIRYALDSAAIVAITDVRGTITFVNKKFCEISGYSRDELLGQNHRMLHSGTHDVDFFRAMYREIANGRVWHGEICNRRKDGSKYWVDTTIVPHVNERGKVDSYTSIRFDITARHEAKAKLRSIVLTDALTGIPNRRCFQERLEELLTSAGDCGPVHLALLDIDTFKEINDTFGHDIGDVLLKDAGQRLMARSCADVFVARLGGDEFGIILSGMCKSEAIAIADKVLADLRVPFQLSSSWRSCSASIGIASHPDDGHTPDALFKAADLALYRAKSLGRDQIKRFEPALREAVERKSELRQAVEAGLDEGQFRLDYQPIVSLNSAPTISLEGLIRWQHPELGLISPASFLADMSDPGLLAALGLFVVEHAFKDMNWLIEQNLPISRIAINVTNADFRSRAFVERFFELSAIYGIAPNRFCIEVTEGVFLGRDYQHVDQLLQTLHESGVEIALDDFGTGFASLTHLRTMPVDKIKIDQSFVANMMASQADAAIVRGIIDIAHSTGKKVVAEGVETLEQAQCLAAFGCDYLQGWFFAKATPLDAIPDVIDNLPVLKRDWSERPSIRSEGSPP
ncbi:EAL domain-containing protein [Rhizobium sp. NTR19]|uniref:EAL domain-containing protein n=1 Tax=Neorhizobium turbinariae TaxID=2937795 RepID=A0ABT0IQ77_9HYPH|nr:GGDEF domain-containing phosphodiesterase [Neorhizobium turbinariae]MCK8780030.1 EAL domain-containing protein [Neorhizobium turbinariae]